MDENHDFLRNPFVKKLDQIVRKNGHDEIFISQALFHFKVFDEHLTNYGRNYSIGEFSTWHMSKLFIDKVEMYSTRRLTCQVKEQTDWVLPSEVFQETKLPVAYRKEIFFVCLNELNILDCRVVTINPSEYNLRIIHKFGSTRMLDDLNLMAVMIKNESNMNILKKELLTCELVRVAVSKIDKELGILYVTALGRISEDDLPPCVLNTPDIDKFPTYASYLKNVPQFQNPAALNDMFVSYGIDPYRIYSYYPQLDSSKCDNELSGETLLKESRFLDVKKYAQLATSFCNGKNFAEAFTNIDKAFEICPERHELLYSLYKIRATINQAKSKTFCKKAFDDWMTAHFLNKNDEIVKKNLSKCLFKLANFYYHSKEYRKAITHAEYALKYDKMNDKATKLWNHLQGI